MPTPSPEHTDWFMEEVHPHGSSLKAYLRSSFPAVRDVEDVVQESYVRIWKARATQPIRSARGFLFQVARHLALDWLRHGRASPIDAGRDLAALSVITHEPDAADATVLRERKRLLIDAVAALPNRCREIVILRKLEDVPQKEVAARLGLSERTVENLLARGVRRCEAYLRDRGMAGRYEP
jgi:RNA polymerase sigma-70 factor (ECF subfamily)